MNYQGSYTKLQNIYILKKASQKHLFFLVPKLTSPPNPNLKLQTAFLTIWNILYSFFFFLPHKQQCQIFMGTFKRKYVRMGECVLYCMVTLRSNTHVLFGMWPIFFGIRKGAAHQKLFPFLLIQALVTTTTPGHLLLWYFLQPHDNKCITMLDMMRIGIQILHVTIFVI